VSVFAPILSKFGISDRYLFKASTWNVTQIRPVGAALILADKWTNWQTDGLMNSLIPLNIAGNNKTYLALHVKRSIFFPGFNQIRNFSSDSIKISNLRINVIRLVGSALTHVDRRTNSLIPFHWRALIWRINVDSSNGIRHGWGDYSPAFNREGPGSIPCEFCGGYSGTGTGFLYSASVFSFQYHTSMPRTYRNTLHNTKTSRWSLELTSSRAVRCLTSGGTGKKSTLTFISVQTCKCIPFY
jgi:hypothetical protein